MMLCLRSFSTTFLSASHTHQINKHAGGCVFAIQVFSPLRWVYYCRILFEASKGMGGNFFNLDSTHFWVGILKQWKPKPNQTPNNPYTEQRIHWSLQTKYLGIIFKLYTLHLIYDKRSKFWQIKWLKIFLTYFSKDKCCRQVFFNLFLPLFSFPMYFPFAVQS